MFRHPLAALRVGLSIAFIVLAAPTFAADPSLHEVYQAAEAGNYRAAQTMMDQVLKDHPNSAKAHFVEAELLAKQGQTGAAGRELSVAEGLAPGLPFAKAGAVAELKARLTPHAMGNGNAIAAPAASPAGGFPWGWLLGGGALLAAFLFFLNRNRQPVVVAAPAGGAMTQGGWGAPSYGPMAPSGGPFSGGSSGLGGGILGGLATGAAVGAGMVAGEALMHRVLDGGHGSPGFSSDSGYLPQADLPSSNYDMGGNDFGISDTSSWDDAGGGGDDWS